MLVEETPRRGLAELAQPVEIFVVGVELAAVVGRVPAVHHDAVQPDAPVLPGRGAARQPALGDQPFRELERAQLRQQRRVEGDLVQPAS